MTKVFISYRRADSQHVTDRFYDAIVDEYGKENVFRDISTIPLGFDFREFIRQKIAESDVILVVIGADWIQILHERQSEKIDFVIFEIEEALRQDKLIIPIMVKNAEMPDPDDLPESIKDLAWRKGTPVRPDPDFSRDVNLLTDGITKSLKMRRESSNEIFDFRSSDMLIYRHISEKMNFNPDLRDKLSQRPDLSMIEFDLVIDRSAALQIIWNIACDIIIYYISEDKYEISQSISDVPDLMEDATDFAIAGDTIIVYLKNKNSLDKLRNEIRSSWIRRAISFVTGSDMRVIFSAIDETKN